MKRDKNQPIFEPISPEEAKQIRAYRESRNLTSGSGIECPSGSADAYTVCQTSHSGAECCYLDNAGNEVHGVCVFGGGFVEVDRLKCSNLPWEVDPDPYN